MRSHHGRSDRAPQCRIPSLRCPFLGIVWCIRARDPVWFEVPRILFLPQRLDFTGPGFVLLICVWGVAQASNLRATGFDCIIFRGALLRI